MITPRGYLSWSSMHLLEASEERWIKHYFEGIKMGGNSGMDFGSVVASDLEHGELTGDDLTDLALAKVPSYDIADQERHTAIKDGKELIQLVYRPDSLKADLSAFREYKVAQKSASWSQRKVNEWGQLPFYATCIFLETNKIPMCHLDEIEGEKDAQGIVSATGKVNTYQRVITMTDILNMMVRMKRAWRKIVEISIANQF